MVGLIQRYHLARIRLEAGYGLAAFSLQAGIMQHMPRLAASQQRLG